MENKNCYVCGTGTLVCDSCRKNYDIVALLPVEKPETPKEKEKLAETLQQGFASTEIDRVHRSAFESTFKKGPRSVIVTARNESVTLERGLFIDLLVELGCSEIIRPIDVIKYETTDNFSMYVAEKVMELYRKKNKA